MTLTRSLMAVILAGVALLGALWVLAIAPKRGDLEDVRGQVVAEQKLLHSAEAQVAAYTVSRQQFHGLLSQLRRLDRAVPGRGDVPTLLRQLQHRAQARGSELSLIALKDGAQAATGAPSTAAAPTTPGAVAGPGGLSALPFTFEYTGKYFDLLEILATARQAVRVKGDRVIWIKGRLLTIDGLSFKRADAETKLTKAVVNGTAYFAPDATATAPAATGAPATAAENGT
jgi:hypothetical protein